MSLTRYAEKRNFKRTPEPRGKATKRKGHSFVIQKHAARRLHYDLRLELDGTLKSWAVTRGPSLVPGDRRLAVEVEDHPLEYGTFEGTIPKGEYGGGSVLVWDNGEWEPIGDPNAGLKKGHLKFKLHGHKLSGEFDLIRMAGNPRDRHNNWLLIKAKDEYARGVNDPDILVERPESVKTGRVIEEIADPSEDRPQSADPAKSTKAKAASVKSGSKAGTVRQTKTAQSRSSSRKAQTRASPKRKTATTTTRAVTTTRTRRPSQQMEQNAPTPTRLAPAELKNSAPSALPTFVDFELATPSEHAPEGPDYIHEIKFDGYRIQARLDHGRVTLRTRSSLDWTSKFSQLSRALAALDVDQAILDGEVVAESGEGFSSFSELQSQIKEGKGDRIVYYVFDLLHFNGYDLTHVSLRDRKKLLSTIVLPESNGFVRLSEVFSTEGETLKKHACRVGFEGIISKRADAPYRSGRTRDWLKIKCSSRQELIIVGYVPSTTARKAIGSLGLGVYEDGRLKFVGKVGSGFTTRTSEELWNQLEPLRRAEPTAEPSPDSDIKNMRWVEPVLVAEVEFREWTASGHVRQAVFQGLRQDKDPTEVTREIALPIEPQNRKARAPANRAPSQRAPSQKQVSPESRVKLTHPDRVYWSDVGVSKQGLADYYSEVWDWIAPHITDRPLALVRCPGGTEDQCFFQKHAWAGLDPQYIQVSHLGNEEVLSISSLEGALALVQAGTLEIHPWGSKLDDPERPDRLTFDLDPGEGVPWTVVESAALSLHDRLQKLGLRSFVKTTGGKGLHVVVPLTPSADWETAKAFTQSIATAMEAEAKDRYVSKMSKSIRAGKIFVDYLRNGRGATAVAAYSPRARPGAPVATPLAWNELGSGISPAHFTVTNIRRRLKSLDKDPWAGIVRVQQTLPKG